LNKDHADNQLVFGTESFREDFNFCQIREKTFSLSVFKCLSERDAN